MRLPTFSRQSATDSPTEERPAAGTSTVAKPDETTTRHFKTPGGAATREPESGRAKVAPRATATTLEQDRVREDKQDKHEDKPVVAAGPKPRASLLATLGLILGVVGAMLVLSGPLLGYGIGVAVLALILSLSGVHATGRRHVAGKSDALIGMVLSLAAIVVGILALTGSLHWLGTDMQPVNTAREWLDAQFVNRF